MTIKASSASLQPQTYFKLLLPSSEPSTPTLHSHHTNTTNNTTTTLLHHHHYTITTPPTAPLPHHHHTTTGTTWATSTVSSKGPKKSKSDSGTRYQHPWLKTITQYFDRMRFNCLSVNTCTRLFLRQPHG